MTRKFLFCLSLGYCLLLCVGGCSLLRPGKSAKEAQKPPIVDTGNIEWKERTWENYAEDRGGVQFYFDKESLSYPSKDLIRVWRKRVFPGRSSSQKEIVSFDEIDCRTDRYRTLELQGLNWDDTKTMIYKRPTPWTNIFENTPDEYFLGKFCNRPPQ
jgi:hypothetical protein